MAERTRHPRDRRRTVVRLTDHGHRIVTESHRCLSHALELLAPDKLAGFTGGLAVVADELDAVAHGTAAGGLSPAPTDARPST